jgi:hypothetical protein
MKLRRQTSSYPWSRRGRLALRVVAAVCGGYACTVALGSAGAQLLVVLGGMARSEAVILTAMLGFILYLALLLWSFSEPRLWRIWALLGAGVMVGLVMQHGLASLLIES